MSAASPDPLNDGFANGDRFNEDFKTPGRKVMKGEELGNFEFGGSSIIVCFEQGRIEFDSDLIGVSQRGEMDVEMGMSLGRATGSK